MAIIKIHHQGKSYTQKYTQGPSLLSLLLDQQKPVTSPCGGAGTCKKCQVEVKGEGLVLACSYYPKEDIEVILPNTSEAQILSTYMTGKELKGDEESIEGLDDSYALAIDIGTTSIVFYWVNRQSGSIDRIHGIENPQAQYGADVITRINYTSSESGLKDLQTVLVAAINQEVQRYLSINNNAKLQKISVAANACMLHLLIGVDPMPMALAPFVAPFTEAKTLHAKELGIEVANDIQIHLLPSASAFVGADIVAGITSLNPPENIKNYLFLDIGTNGEMAIVTPDKIFSCATAAGPAFEGANISCGMGAFEGAVSIYNKDGFKTIADKPAKGICGSGLIDIVSFLLKEEHIGADGTLDKDFVVATANESEGGKEVVLTPQDIREVQLAKSAIFTGIKLLLQEANLCFKDLDSVYLAGGFGNYMNPDNAVKIGLLPNDTTVPIVPVGNTSGAGAVLHAIHNEFADRLNETVNRMTTIDLSKHPDFELEFAMNMYFS